MLRVTCLELKSMIVGDHRCTCMYIHRICFNRNLMDSVFMGLGKQTRWVVNLKRHSPPRALGCPIVKDRAIITSLMRDCFSVDYIDFLFTTLL